MAKQQEAPGNVNAFQRSKAINDCQTFWEDYRLEQWTAHIMNAIHWWINSTQKVWIWGVWWLGCWSLSKLNVSAPSKVETKEAGYTQITSLLSKAKNLNPSESQNCVCICELFENWLMNRDNHCTHQDRSWVSSASHRLKFEGSAFVIFDHN